MAQQSSSAGTEWRGGVPFPAQIDDTVLDAFLGQLDSHIDAKLDQRFAAMPAVNPGHKGEPSGGVAAIIGVGIPFVVLAGVFGHVAGTVLAVLIVGGLAMLRLLRD